ncbi:hypothetical protein CDL15_Pgr016941 [Punica granatum]|uniref:Uncharacterized protein n=1 Tax=Punica granatum TaxID=22663 RepID=A0A218WY27_PUNGR|nr:hypothetical protein CDL15_Pgr016941 [Punica granatum]
MKSSFSINNLSWYQSIKILGECYLLWFRISRSVVSRGRDGEWGRNFREGFRRGGG